MNTTIGAYVYRYLHRWKIINNQPNHPNILGIYKRELNNTDKEILVVGKDFTILDKMKYSCDIPGDYEYSAHYLGNRLFESFGNRFGY